MLEINSQGPVLPKSPFDHSLGFIKAWVIKKKIVYFFSKLSKLSINRKNIDGVNDVFIATQSDDWLNDWKNVFITGKLVEKLHHLSCDFQLKFINRFWLSNLKNWYGSFRRPMIHWRLLSTAVLPFYTYIVQRPPHLGWWVNFWCILINILKN